MKKDLKSETFSHLKTYIERHKAKFLTELQQFLSIPSVSTHESFKDDVFKAAEFVRDRLKEAGANRADIFETQGHPVVYGERMVDKRCPTLLCYGHYDVQPADPYELWETPPFEPNIRHDRLYARGAADDKGQVYMHIKAMETLLQTQTPFCNLKFIIEGEEEIGSPSLRPFLEKHKRLLASDSIVVSDTAFVDEGVPSITVGVRGLSYMELSVQGPKRDLHSGEYGGAIDNPVQVLCEALAKLRDRKTGKITVPGFYDDVVPLSEEERKVYSRIPFSERSYRQKLDVDDTFGEAGYTTLERVGFRPSLDIHGIWGGYVQEGAKTVLPSQVHAKLSFRLVPKQDPDKITSQCVKYLKTLFPNTVKVSVRPHHSSEASVLSVQTPTYRAAEKALGMVFGKKPLPIRCGGSIPIVPAFEKVLGHAPVLMGFGLPQDAIHSPNESFHLNQYFKGIQTLALFYAQCVDMQA